MRAAHLLLMLAATAPPCRGWAIVTRQDTHGRFRFYNQTNVTTFKGPVQLRGVSLTGFETGTIGVSSGAAGFWLFEAKDASTTGSKVLDFPMTKTVIKNIVKTLVAETIDPVTELTGWGANIVRVPICGSAWLQNYSIADYGTTEALAGYRDWVDVAVKAATDLGKQVVLDNHVWAIAKQSGKVRNHGNEDGCNGINNNQDTPPVDSCAKSDWYGEYTSTRTGKTYNKGHDPFSWQCPISNADGVSIDNLRRRGVNSSVTGKEHFLNLWYELALRYKNNTNVWFELYNEPYQRGMSTYKEGEPNCKSNGDGSSIVCLPGTGQGDPTPEKDYDWDFWSTLMNDTIHVIRDEAKATNIIVVSGFDFNYDYLGDGSSTTGGPIARPALVRWQGAAATPVPNVAFSFHPYQHGSCCGHISGDDRIDLSADDPYQSAFCAHGTDPSRQTRSTDWPTPGKDPSQWPWSPSRADTPLSGVPLPPNEPEAFCSSAGYSPTLDKKLPPCQWAPKAVRPEWYDAGSKKHTQQGLCVGQNSTCAHLSEAECCTLPENETDAGGWARYVQPMERHGPLIATEFGTFDCSTPFVTSLLGWAGRNNVSWTAWALWPQNKGGPGSGACGYPSVLQPTGGDSGDGDYLFSNGITNCRSIGPDGQNQGCAKLLQFLGHNGQTIKENILGTAPPPPAPGCPVSPPPAPPSAPPLPGCTGGTMLTCVETCDDLPMDEQKMCVAGCVEQCKKRRQLSDDGRAASSGRPSRSISRVAAPRATCAKGAAGSVQMVATWNDLLEQVSNGTASCVLVNVTSLVVNERQLVVKAGRTVAIAPATPAPTKVTFVGAGTAYPGNVTDKSMIQVDVGGSLTMERIIVKGGRSANSTAGISNSGELVLRYCQLRDNAATNQTLYAGGLGNNGSATLVSCEVGPNNTAQAKFAGGGIANDGEMDLFNCTVHNNTAAWSGGGIGNGDEGRLNLTNCSVGHNKAQNGGGGGLGNSGQVHIENSSFFANEAQGGGAIGTGIGHYYNDPNSTNPSSKNLAHVVVVGSEIRDNRAWGSTKGGGGGGIGNGAALRLEKCTLRNNKAISGGGGIGTGGDPQRRDDFASVEVVDSQLINNKAQSGGGLGNQFGGYVKIASSVVSGNQANQGTQGGNGGGLSNYGWVNSETAGDRMYTVIFVEDSNITDNVAEQNGGGVSIDFFSDALLVRTRVVRNTASKYGGGVCNSGSELSMSECHISFNRASALEDGAGGGLTQVNHQLGELKASPRTVLTSCTLQANNATNFGGGFYKLNGNATLNSVAIISNEAKSGGGLHSNSAAETTSGGLTAFSLQDFTLVIGSNITNNTAQYGAGVANYGKRCVLQNGTLVSGNVLKRGMSPTVLSGGAGSAVYNTVPGGLSYVLPAGKGRYVDASFVCQKVHCDYDTCPQTCDWAEYQGRTMVQLPLTINGDYPPACGKGFFGNDTRSEHQNTSRCSGICPLGHYCPDEPTFVPKECPDGTFAFSLGLADKKDCAYCPPNSFANSSVPADQRTRSQACILCGLNSGTGGQDGRTNISACRCEENYYRAHEDDLDCKPCLSGGLCTDGASLGSLRLCPGYWRPSPASSDIRPCKSHASCPGNLPPGMSCGQGGAAETAADETALLAEAPPNGTADDQSMYCAQGLTGPYCSLCTKGGYHYVDESAGICYSCDKSYAILFSVLGLLALMGAGVALHQRSVKCRVCLQRWVARAAKLLGVRGANPYERWQEARLSLMRVLPRLRVTAKQTVTFYQIVTHVPEVYLVVLPASYTGLLKSLGVFNLNPSSVEVQLRCLGMASFFEEILGLALVPMIIVAATLAHAKLSRKPLVTALPFLLKFTFLTFSFVSSRAFQAFTCDCIDVGEGHTTCYLQADYSIMCRDGGVIQNEWARVLGLSWIVLLLYPIGVPVLYSTLIFSVGRRAIHLRETSVSDAMLFLMDDYKPRFFWWELLETAKKLTLTGFFVLILPGSVAQLVCGLVLVLFYLVLQVYAQPFKRREHNVVALTANLLVAMLFLSLIVLDEQYLFETVTGTLSQGLRRRFDLSGLSNTSVLFLCTLGLLFVVVGLFVQDMHATRRQPTLRWRVTSEIVRTPPTKTERGWHLMISHVWATGQDQARVIAQGLAMLQPDLRVFLDVDELQTIGVHLHKGERGERRVATSFHAPELPPELVASQSGDPAVEGAAAAAADAAAAAATAGPPPPGSSSAAQSFSNDPALKLHPLRASSSLPSSLEDVVARSDHFLIFLSDGFFSSVSTLRELRAACDLGKPLVLVLEEDPKHGGAPLEAAIAECPAELRSQIFHRGHPLVRWHRTSPFQLISLRQILAAVLTPHAGKHGRVAPCLIGCDGRPVDGADVFATTEMARQRLVVPPPSAASRRLVCTADAASQARARRLVHEMLDKADQAPPRAAVIDGEGDADHFLLFLDAQTDFGETAAAADGGATLADEVEAAIERGQHLVIAFAGGGAGASLDEQIRRAPARLRAKGLFSELVVPLHDGEHREVSLQLLARAFHPPAAGRGNWVADGFDSVVARLRASSRLSARSPGSAGGGGSGGIGNEARLLPEGEGEA